MYLHKTSRARAELQPGVRTLGQRERTLLLLSDGSRLAQDFYLLFGGDGEKIVLRLLSEGYLERRASPDSPPMRAAHSVSAQIVEKIKPEIKPLNEAVAGPVSELSTFSTLSNFDNSTNFGNTASGADSFEGKRSLATTRMFLFDICERMFARRNPEMAEHLREALRNAKDRDSMLAVSRQLLAHIEKLAGSERADALGERIAMLLPDNSRTNVAN